MNRFQCLWKYKQGQCVYRNLFYYFFLLGINQHSLCVCVNTNTSIKCMWNRKPYNSIHKVKRAIYSEERKFLGKHEYALFEPIHWWIFFQTYGVENGDSINNMKHIGNRHRKKELQHWPKKEIQVNEIQSENKTGKHFY